MEYRRLGESNRSRVGVSDEWHLVLAKSFEDITFGFVSQRLPSIAQTQPIAVQHRRADRITEQRQVSTTPADIAQSMRCP